MNGEERGFLHAIVSEPGDDTPRLVYADWLDEHDQPERAEFIRVQVAEPVPEDVEPPDYPERHRHLWERVYRAEFYPARLFGSIPATIRHFQRGFLGRIRCAAAEFLRYADALVWHPAQTAACGVCHGNGRFCSGPCHGTGTVPRPFVETAQPIERVTLTTWPLRAHLWRGTEPDGATISGRLAELWPGITFELPTPRVTVGGTFGIAVINGVTVAPGDTIAGYPVLAEPAAHSSLDLDATPVFESPAVPLDGWTIEVRDVMYDATTHPPWPVRTGSLVWEGVVDSRPEIRTGETFGPATAIDQYGQSWRLPSCRVGFFRWTTEPGGLRLRIEAETVGVFDRAGPPPRRTADFTPIVTPSV